MEKKDKNMWLTITLFMLTVAGYGCYSFLMAPENPGNNSNFPSNRMNVDNSGQFYLDSSSK